jgi:hypothetical protein
MFKSIFKHNLVGAALVVMALAMAPIGLKYSAHHGLELGFQQAEAQALTDYAENAIVDRVLRAQASPAFATTWYVALFTTACSDSAPGTEVSGGNYARASLAASLANWAGTLAAGNTAASSGTGGQTSNNSTITFATPSAGWGTVSHWGLYDALAAGNMWICMSLTTSKTINSGDTVSFATTALSVTLQ